MLSPSRQFRSHRYAPRSQSGFTLIEIVIALAVLGVMAAGCYIGFNSINAYAVSTRLYSEAQTAAQNQIDLVLSREPFDCSSSGAYISGSFDPTLNKIPVELMTTSELDLLVSVGGVVFPTAAPSATPATSSSYYPYYPYYRENGTGPIKKQAFIYQDPITGTVVVSGTLTSIVTDASMSMSFINSSNLNTRKANVTVAYNFRGRPYTLSMDTLRTSDQ